MIIEGSVEVKLPTIWTDEKQSRAEAIRNSQQPTFPIGFLFLKLPPPPCAVLLVVNANEWLWIILLRVSLLLCIIYIRILIIWIQNCQAFDGLKCSWQLLATPYGHNRVYLNPPWSQLDCWLEKAGMLWTTEDSGLQFWSCPNLSTVHSGLSWASFRQR